MDNETFLDVIDGLFAYDTGATDYGYNSKELKGELQEHLRCLNIDARNKLFTDYIKLYFFPNKNADNMFSIVDVKRFIDWLEYEIDISLD